MYHLCTGLGESVAADGTGRMVKLGQAAQAKEISEAGQHLQQPLILIPTSFVKSAGCGGREAAGSQGALIRCHFPCHPFCLALQHHVMDAPNPTPPSLSPASISPAFISGRECLPRVRRAPAALLHPSRALLQPGCHSSWPAPVSIS